MGRLEVTPTTVAWRLTRGEKALALHGDVVVPRSSVTEVRVVPTAWAAVRGVRAPGYGMPRHRLLGTWRSHGWKDFVDVRYGEPGVIVELEAGPGFARLVLSMPDPSAAVQELAALP
jgi:hypothetical protein